MELRDVVTFHVVGVECAKGYRSKLQGGGKKAELPLSSNYIGLCELALLFWQEDGEDIC